jgi:(1->4)-alpha-D-glucan 1-alpha-D-glucosylmutase
VERALERGVVTIVPRATYRLQLRGGFGFNEAAAIAPYLAGLGVSHVYLSPFFKARPGSAHGYDITNHAELNPELGTEAEYSSMIHAFRREGVKRILDFVPNHMGVGGADNPLWLDVLEWGPESRYAGWFDIDWSARDGSGQDKLLAPVLGEQYGEALRTSKLQLKFDDGAFAIWAYDEHKFPVCPLTYPLILGHKNAALDIMAIDFSTCRNGAPRSPSGRATLRRNWRDSRALTRKLAARSAPDSLRSTATGANWKR